MITIWGTGLAKGQLHQVYFMDVQKYTSSVQSNVNCLPYSKWFHLLDIMQMPLLAAWCVALKYFSWQIEVHCRPCLAVYFALPFLSVCNCGGCGWNRSLRGQPRQSSQARKEQVAIPVTRPFLISVRRVSWVLTRLQLPWATKDPWQACIKACGDRSPWQKVALSAWALSQVTCVKSVDRDPHKQKHPNRRCGCNYSLH